jgi:hypothetical protein
VLGRVAAAVVFMLTLTAGVLVPVATPAEAAVGPVTVSAGPASVVEGNVGTRRLIFTVTLSRVLGGPSSVRYATHAGTALPGIDFVSKSGQLSIPAHTTSATVAVLVNGNTAVDATRSFGLTLSDPVGVVLGRAEAIGTIVDDDPVSGIRVSIGSATAFAGNANTQLTFPVTLSNSAPTDVSVDYSTRSGSAREAVDFSHTAGRLTIPAGSRTTEVTVAVRRSGGTLGAPVEKFTVRLTNPSGAAIGRATGTGTIRRTGYGTTAAWSQAGRDAGLTANVVGEQQLSAANAAGLHQLWALTLPWGTERGLEPVSDGNAIYIVKVPNVVPDQIYGRLVALDLDDGHELWSVPANADHRENLAVSDGLVLTTSRCAPYICLQAYHTSDGSLAWKYQTTSEGFMAPPTVANGIVFAVDAFGLLELSLATGKAVSGIPESGDHQASYANGRVFHDYGAYDPVTRQRLWYAAYGYDRVTDGMTVYTTENMRVVARDAATGAERWAAATNCDDSPPALSAEAVVVQGCSKVRAWEPQTGASLWPAYTQAASSDLQPTIANGLVFVNDENGTLTLLNAATGGLVTAIDEHSNMPYGSVVVVNGKVISSGYQLRVYGL